ncbi:hypothetical protein [Anaeromonas frigoriresistens]|uniref:hypothetical protein n=1 Tax=Anaeromonas frigoriresistens TaxID=2683708 RepID=UPI001A9C5391|nr:hypothetical protein [Anaeromonas frigoriresistens]
MGSLTIRPHEKPLKSLYPLLFTYPIIPSFPVKSFPLKYPKSPFSSLSSFWYISDPSSTLLSLESVVVLAPETVSAISVSSFFSSLTDAPLLALLLTIDHMISKLKEPYITPIL